MRRAPSRSDYGGYGAEPDILKSRIIAEEFIAAGAPRGTGGAGHLDAGADPAGGGVRGAEAAAGSRRRCAARSIWCQGYSEPGAGSDLASCRPRRSRTATTSSSIGSEDLDVAPRAQAEMMFCLVRTEPTSRKHEGISYILFPMKHAGHRGPAAEDHDRPAPSSTRCSSPTCACRRPQVVGGRGRGLGQWPMRR